MDGARNPPLAGRGVKDRGAALLAAMRNKNRRPIEAGNQGQPAPTEALSDTTQSPLDVQSTAVGRGALLIWALYSRMSSATSVTSNTAQLLSVDKHSWNVWRSSLGWQQELAEKQLATLGGGRRERNVWVWTEVWFSCWQKRQKVQTRQPTERGILTYEDYWWCLSVPTSYA